jgi:hypothetical protein
VGAVIASPRGPEQFEKVFQRRRKIHDVPFAWVTAMPSTQSQTAWPRRPGWDRLSPPVGWSAGHVAADRVQLRDGLGERAIAQVV